MDNNITKKSFMINFMQHSKLLKLKHIILDPQLRIKSN